MTLYVHILRAAAAAVVITAAAALPAQAQNSPVPPALQSVAVETVTVTATRSVDAVLAQPSTAGSRLNLTPLETPASVAVVPGTLLRTLGVESVIDAKTLAPGVSSANSPGNGGNLLSARGFSGQNSVKQLYNGLEIYNAGGVVSFPFDAWNVERVEALVGPASVLYGTGAIGGAVNVVAKRPDPSSPGTVVRLGLGSFKSLQQAIGSTGPVGDSPALSYRFDVSHRSADNWIDRGESDTTTVAASLRWDASSALRMVLAVDYGRQLPMHYLGTPVAAGAPVPGTLHRNYNIADNDLYFQDGRLTLETDWLVLQTPSETLSLRNTTYAFEHSRRYRDATLFAFQPATSTSAATVRRTSYRDIDYSKQKQVGTQTQLKWESQLAGLKNDFLAGFELNRIRYDRFDNVRGGASVVDAFNPVPGLYRDAYLQESKPFYFMLVKQLGLFAENRLKLSDDLSLVAGLRADHYRNDRFDRIVPALTRSKLDAVSGNLGLVFNPLPNLALYAQAATASDPVSSLASIGANQQGFGLSEGRQFEIGAKQSLWKGQFEWTLAAYKLVKKDLLTPNLANPTISEQVGQQSSRGIEAAVSARLGAVRVDLNGTVLQPRFDEFGAQVGNSVVSLAGKVPNVVHKKAANLLVMWDIASGLDASATVRYVGPRFTNNTNTDSLPAYTLVNLGLGWQVAQPLKLELRLENAADKVYATQGSATQWLLGRPRAVWVAGTYAF